MTANRASVYNEPVRRTDAAGNHQEANASILRSKHCRARRQRQTTNLALVPTPPGGQSRCSEAVFGPSGPLG